MDKIITCPKCKKKLERKTNSMVCENNHSYDISRTGYVNLLSQVKSNFYTKELFRSRKYIFNKGYYDKLIEELYKKIKDYIINSKCKVINILDAGCGEGYYSYKLKNMLDEDISKLHLLGDTEINFYSFDISKEAILIGAKTYKGINFFVADLSDIPVEDNSIDIILDILTPSNYNEFKRILKNDALILKVIPDKNYLIELRNEFKESLRNKEINNDNVVDLFSDNFMAVSVVDIDYKEKIDEVTTINFAKMTPMLGNINLKDFKADHINEISINLKILVGKN